MLKRAGRGHHVSGAAGTRPGECAVLCPACPHSGRNLLPGWKDVPKEKRYEQIIMFTTSLINSGG